MSCKQAYARWRSYLRRAPTRSLTGLTREDSGDHGAQQPRTPGSACVLDCDNMVTDSRSGSRCPVGHALCADCTTKYVEKTLLPHGVVWWDRIRCVDPECTAEYMEGGSVRRCISRRLVDIIESAQLEVVSMIDAEGRRGSRRPRVGGRRGPHYQAVSALRGTIR